MQHLNTPSEYGCISTAGGDCDCHCIALEKGPPAGGAKGRARRKGRATQRSSGVEGDSAGDARCQRYFFLKLNFLHARA